MDNYIEYVKSKLENLDDIFYREISIKDKNIMLAFCEPLVDTELVSNYVVRSIVEIIIEDINSLEEENDPKNLKEIIELKLKQNDINLESKIAISKIKKIDKEKENIFKYILSGFVAIFLDDSIYVVEAKSNLNRGIEKPANENTIRGAKDSFVENIMQNIGLIRKRIKSEHLVYKESEIGRQTKTKVGIIYMSNIAKEPLVKFVEEKLKKIDIDGILSTNYIQELIEEKNDSNFPVSINTERPDLTCYHLLQGRIVIMMDNCPYALILPSFFEDYINTMEDMFEKSKNVTITKLIRYFCLALTIVIPALYLSLITFNQESIPTDLLKSFTVQRESVPFPAFIEALCMIFAFEILRESDLRSNKISGNTLSIVGALIIGEAAVNAGVVSPIMIIVVALTMISGLAFSDINLINALRKWRIIYLILASICGLVGIGIATIFYVVSLVSTQSYTKSYTYPIAPFNFREFKDSVLSRINISKDKTRKKILTNNLTKAR